ncbi:MAG: hypothetical protein HUU38_13110 [Anaerolineales bacterium]|jgi:hypothetical protein|nr:hypothetical protein [Anaerolineales bacterium]
MPSSVTDIVKAYFGTFSLMSADKAALFLADDFKMIGFDERPLGKVVWVGVMNAIKTAIPDLKIKLSEVQEKGNVVNLKYYGVGTHRESLDLSVLNGPVLPASGKTVTFPGSHWALTVVAGKITQEELVTPPSADTGLAGIINACG